MISQGDGDVAQKLIKRSFPRLRCRISGWCSGSRRCCPATPQAGGSAAMASAEVWPRDEPSKVEMHDCISGGEIELIWVRQISDW
uniref:Uncharacterized protein n=1 Tax=Kalanchoe fedtschenkoi TaxID=63787 RepID=A0A7N0TND7_KALFE